MAGGGANTPRLPAESRVVVPADMLAAMFQQGASYEGDPQLYTHCVIFNVVRTCRDGRYRSLHQKPAYFRKMAAGAAYRNALAWNLRTRLGIRMEQYGPDGAFTRIAGIPEALVAHWSKRRKTIAKSGGAGSCYKLDYRVRALGGAKRHERWSSECADFVDPGELIGSLIGQEVGQPPDTPFERASCTDAVLARLAARTEGVRLCQVVQAVENAAAGLFDRAATADILARVLQAGMVVRRQCRDGQRTAGMAAAMIAGPLRWTRQWELRSAGRRRVASAFGD